LKISGSHALPFSPEQAFSLLQDPEALARAIPGCQSLEKTGENEYHMKMKMVLAAISGNFEGNVRLSEQMPPSSFRMDVDGSGKIGFVKGSGVLTITPVDGGSSVAYDGDVQIGGTIAAVGQRLIDTTSKMMIKKFFERIVSG
jgi:uncharacterized protein